jgi:hypothetical protein
MPVLTVRVAVRAGDGVVRGEDAGGAAGVSTVEATGAGVVLIVSVLAEMFGVGTDAESTCATVGVIDVSAVMGTSISFALLPKYRRSVSGIVNSNP